MGVAAYNRGSDLISRQISAEQRPTEFVMMDELNALPKFDYASKPFSEIIFVHSHNGWWAQCPTTGFGYWYKTLREAVRSWQVSIIGYSNGEWRAIPLGNNNEKS